MVEGLEVVACCLCQHDAPATPRRSGSQARHTAKGHLGQNKEVEVVQLGGVGFGEDGIGAIEVAGDIPNLGRKLKTGDPHVCGAWPGGLLGGGRVFAMEVGGGGGRWESRWWLERWRAGYYVCLVLLGMSYRGWCNNDGDAKDGLKEEEAWRGEGEEKGPAGSCSDRPTGCSRFGGGG